MLIGLAACAGPGPVDPVAWTGQQPAHWAEGPPSAASGPVLPGAWWLALQDPALDRLMPQARFASVEQALARVDEARAQLGQQQAASQPQLLGALNVQRGLEQDGGQKLVSRAGPSVRLGWEIDLWGRLAHASKAAERRSVQREAEAELAQLLAQAQLAELVLQERACRRLAELQGDDVASWTRVMQMQRERLSAGAQSEQGLARQEVQAAALSAQLAETQGQCRSLRQAMRALVGVSQHVLAEALALERREWHPPPPLRPEQPAALLLRHPQLRAASASADAAAHDLGVAQSAHLPSLNLAALLSHQWLRVLGHGSEQDSWSLGATLAGPLADGGAGAAREEAARARLRQALAGLDQALRQTVREVEAGLAQQAATQQQWRAMARRAEAGAQSWRFAQAAAAAGRLNAMELEEAARQRRAAEQALIVAQRDLALAWTGLVKAAGQAPLHLELQP